MNRRITTWNTALDYKHQGFVTNWIAIVSVLFNHHLFISLFHYLTCIDSLPDILFLLTISLFFFLSGFSYPCWMKDLFMICLLFCGFLCFICCSISSRWEENNYIYCRLSLTNVQLLLCRAVELPWIFPGAPLIFRGVPANIHDNPGRYGFTSWLDLSTIYGKFVFHSSPPDCPSVINVMSQGIANINQYMH